MSAPGTGSSPSEPERAGPSASDAPTAAAAALSTMWAVQPRFEHDLPAFLTRAAELGYSAVEINHSMTPAQVEAIQRYGRLAIGGVHGPAPLERHPKHGWNRSMNLAAEDDSERRAAIEAHIASIELAASTGAPHVVVHLGSAGERLLGAERRLRRLYARRVAAPAAVEEEWHDAVASAHREREAIALPFLERARMSLSELAAAAEHHRVTLGLECRLGYHEIPLPDECAYLVRDHHPDVVGYLHDVGHAEVQHRLGVTALDSWFELLGDRLVAFHLHDVRGLTDHRAPGNGDVDFAWLAARMPDNAARVFEIDQHETDADLATGLQLLRAHGIIAG